MASASPLEIPVLIKFREMIADLELKEEDSTDIKLLRWLRARELDLDKASGMLRSSLEWKKLNDFDNILKWCPPKNYRSKFPYEIVGRDDFGHPIVILEFGQWDVKKVMNNGGREEWCRYMDQLFARVFHDMKLASEHFEREITQFVLIIDFAGFSMGQLSSFTNIESQIEVARRFDLNYPESLYSAYFLNTSKVFSIAFSFAKPFLSARTMAKIHVLTTSNEWMPELLKNLPSDQLPVKYGGIRLA